METQPLGAATAGSVFKNPPGHSAGQLIEAAELKGFRLGDAEVSEKHANFIVNRGQATAIEVHAVMKEIQERVAVTSGILLEPEIEMIGMG
jgi:UDP-N-acetylmuramate dehydrogenase